MLEWERCGDRFKYHAPWKHHKQWPVRWVETFKKGLWIGASRINVSGYTTKELKEMAEDFLCEIPTT